MGFPSEFWLGHVGRRLGPFPTYGPENLRTNATSGYFCEGKAGVKMTEYLPLLSLEQIAENISVFSVQLRGLVKAFGSSRKHEPRFYQGRLSGDVLNICERADAYYLTGREQVLCSKCQRLCRVASAPVRNSDTEVDGH